jgi:hypothetical protein
MVSKKKKLDSTRGKKSKGKDDAAIDSNKNHEVHEEKADSASATSAGTVTTAESTKSTTSRGKRSIICMYKVVVKKAMGKKFKVTYNTTGNPNGRERHTLQSYIGMLARTMVPINVNSWPDVDADLKDRIWEDIQVMQLAFFIFEILILTLGTIIWFYTLSTEYIQSGSGKQKIGIDICWYQMEAIQDYINQQVCAAILGTKEEIKKAPKAVQFCWVKAMEGIRIREVYRGLAGMLVDYIHQS